MDNDKLKLCTCRRCGHLIKYHEKDTYWNEHNSGYSTKLIKCDNCGNDNILKYEGDDWFDGR